MLGGTSEPAWVSSWDPAGRRDSSKTLKIDRFPRRSNPMLMVQPQQVEGNPSMETRKVRLLTRNIVSWYVRATSSSPAVYPRLPTEYSLRTFVPVFNRRVSEVQNILISKLNQSNTDVIKVEVTLYMSRATLDIIGLGGLGTHDGNDIPLTNDDPRRL